MTLNVKSSVITDGNKVYLDNINLIRNNILKFQSPDDFYFISILQRKKDHPNGPANENARMIANWCVKNLVYFDRKIDLIKEYCEHFNARAYIKPQVRSCKAINRQILKFMADQIDNGDLAYSTLTREIISSYHSSRAKRYVLDLDEISYQDVTDIKKKISDIFKSDNRDKEIDDIVIVPTFNGYHIVTPGFNPNSLQLEKDVIKSDADTILYACKPITN